MGAFFAGLISRGETYMQPNSLNFLKIGLKSNPKCKSACCGRRISTNISKFSQLNGCAIKNEREIRHSIIRFQDYFRSNSIVIRDGTNRDILSLKLSTVLSDC